MHSRQHGRGLALPAAALATNNPVGYVVRPARLNGERSEPFYGTGLTQLYIRNIRSQTTPVMKYTEIIRPQNRPPITMDFDRNIPPSALRMRRPGPGFPVSVRFDAKMTIRTESVPRQYRSEDVLGVSTHRPHRSRTDGVGVGGDPHRRYTQPRKG